ncbi:phage tail protein [Fischerella thermalis CCMEE 5201]|jgi:phage tail sheath protein FI|nr:phage tail protein [Fischerella thermalis CCMEE 5201]
MAYKTPGVYVEEKSIFPPSVAQVATAIPAFIGYTERADDRAKDDLLLKPKKITSLLEYRQYFGGSPPLQISTVKLDSNNSLVEAKVQPKYLLYDSLQLFFLNGGGECYIISVGKYGNTVALSPGLNDGLVVLEKEDEPTIILFPDAILLSEDDFYTLQQSALAQCNKLKDRFAIFDLQEQENPNNLTTIGVNTFRDRIGTSNLKYGAAYAPHLKTNLRKDIKYRDFRNTTTQPTRFTRSGVPISLDALTNDTTILSLINNLNTAINDVELLAQDLNTLATTLQAAPFSISADLSQNLRLSFDYLYNLAISDNTFAHYQNLLDFLYNIIVTADGWFYDTNPTGPSAGYRTEAVNKVFSALKAAIANIIAFDKGGNAATLGGTLNRFTTFAGSLINQNNYAPEIVWTAAGNPPANNAPFTGSNEAERRRNSLPFTRDLFEQLIVSIDGLIEIGNARMKTLEDSLIEQFPIYKNLIEQLNQALSTIPPSGAIAGVYAQVDASRGVWKAPANVSLSGVTGLTYNFSESDTDNLNVDTNFGKSINAIKFFTGMGFMVWGARTLAGNDNEWRYISVRRFFNMVEESVKKSTMWAVFEPNDANTWIKVKGMIENFLTLQWRSGALQGAKADESFFVKIGLGETMTSIDILEGRMNVEIGMAVVRPAEFIILIFSHKLVQF